MRVRVSPWAPCNRCERRRFRNCHTDCHTRSSLFAHLGDPWQGNDLAHFARDLELLDLGAERRPGHRRVDVQDVAARPVGDHFQQVGPSAVHPGKGDEAAPQVVEPTPAVAMAAAAVNLSQERATLDCC